MAAIIIVTSNSTVVNPRALVAMAGSIRPVTK
jgi:hypothetical protein